jgi:hypothetical protein
MNKLMTNDEVAELLSVKPATSGCVVRVWIDALDDSSWGWLSRR